MSARAGVRTPTASTSGRTSKRSSGRCRAVPVVYGSKNWDDPNAAYTVIQAFIPGFYGIDMRSTVLVGYGVSEGRGHFVYDDAVLRWPDEGDSVLQTGHIAPACAASPVNAAS